MNYGCGNSNGRCETTFSRCRFESYLQPLIWCVAQSVEHLIVNQAVARSSRAAPATV